MDWITILLLLLISLAGETIQAATGFGYGTFIMMFLPYLMPSYAEATAVSGMVCLVTAGIIAYEKRQYVAWKRLLAPLGTYAVTLFFAAWFCARAPQAMLEKILGVVLILLSIYLYFCNEKIKIRPTATNGMIAGGTSGVLSGLFSMGGPPTVVYFSSCSENPNVYLATIQMYYVISMAYATIVRAANGMMTLHVIEAGAASLAGAFIGIIIGRFIFNRLDAARLKKMIYAFMVVSGIALLLR